MKTFETVTSEFQYIQRWDRSQLEWRSESESWNKDSSPVHCWTIDYCTTATCQYEALEQDVVATCVAVNCTSHHSRRAAAAAAAHSITCDVNICNNYLHCLSPCSLKCSGTALPSFIQTVSCASSLEIVKQCPRQFAFELTSEMIANRTEKFSGFWL